MCGRERASIGSGLSWNDPSMLWVSLAFWSSRNRLGEFFFSYSVALYYRVRESGFQYFFRHEYSDGKLRRSFHGCGPRNSQNVVVNSKSHETLGFQLSRMLHPRAAQLHVW